MHRQINGLTDIYHATCYITETSHWGEGRRLGRVAHGWLKVRLQTFRVWSQNLWPYSLGFPATLQSMVNDRSFEIRVYIVYCCLKEVMRRMKGGETPRSHYEHHLDAKHPHIFSVALLAIAGKGGSIHLIFFLKVAWFFSKCTFLNFCLFIYCKTTTSTST